MKKDRSQDQLVLAKLTSPSPAQEDHSLLKYFGNLLRPAVPSEVFLTYWRFANERQNVFFRRLSQQLPPWTSDPVIDEYKFTNTYRAADRVSQYLIRHVQYNRSWGVDDLIFRALIFKIFNRIETWMLLEQKLGAVTVDNFRVNSYAAILEEAMKMGARIYSAAYIMPSGGPKSGFSRKHEMHLHLLKRMLTERLPERIATCSSMQEAFTLLRAYPTIGDFLGYQYITDINYSTMTNFSEMDFVVPGPGAIEGMQKCFHDLGGQSGADVIKRVAAIQEEAFTALSLNFKYLGNRPLQLIDCQNIFCEVAKYARVTHPSFTPENGRSRIKQKFRPNPDTVDYFFPPKWKVKLQRNN